MAMQVEHDEENPRDLPKATYEELEVNEQLLDNIDNRLVSIQHHLSRPVYKQRAEIIKKIPNFWALVLEDAPPEIDQYIQPSDSLIFAQCLQNVQVERFEIPDSLPSDPYAPVVPSENPTQKWGEPRSIKITFTFGENEFFQDKVLEKKFYFRRAKDGWSGLVSDPVPIRWKPGKDLTGGLIDAAVKLVAADTKAKAAANGAKYGRAKLPESEKVKKLLEKSGGDMSFFAFFGFRGRNVSKAESAAAFKERYEEVAKIMQGQSTDDDDDDEEATEDVMDEFETEIFPDGEDVALAIAEDMWPGATRYFTGPDFSDVDFEEDEDEDEDEDEEMADGDDDDDDEDEDEEEEKVPDIRGLANAQKRAGGAAAARKPRRR